MRREYLARLLARKTSPTGTLQFCVQQILSNPGIVGSGPNELVAELFGVTSLTGNGVTTVSDPRLSLALLARSAPTGNR